MNEKKTPPFFLEVEGFEAGHSAAESLTRRRRLVNRLKTAALCTARAAFGSSAPKTGLRMRRLLL